MKYITFGNESFQLCFNEADGRPEQILYLGKVIPLVGKLWSIRTKQGDLGIADMTKFWFERYTDVLKLYWTTSRETVIVNLRCDRDGKVRMNISAEVAQDNAVRDVRFPMIGGLNFEKDNYLLITWQNGRILKNPVETFLRKGMEVPFWVGRGKFGYENEYPAALSFQYTTFYSEDYGFYFATEDADAHIKTFAYDYNRELDALDFSVVNYPENMGKTTGYCMNYDFVLQMYRGDWQSATGIYRQWATRQKWCKQRLVDKKLPEKLLKTDLWRINHTNYELGTRTQEYFDTSVRLRDELDCNVALHWYGWNMGVHDKDYPEYISEEKKAEGWPEELRAWNRKFDDAGIVKIPYHNARLWEKKTKSWTQENVPALAIKDENGEMLDEPWMPWMGYELKAICPGTAKWQNKVADLCREYGTELGFDGVYLDQIASFNATLCFDETHPHPLGGGTWWNDSYHRMLDRTREIVGEEQILTTESCCESYVDVFDLFLILDTNFQYTAFNAMSGGNAWSVPLFSLIYGEYALSYGSICRFDNRLDRFEYNYIRNLLWGILPSIEGVDMAELENGRQYVEVTKRGVDFFKEHKDMFLYGRLAEIPEYRCESLTMDWEARDEQKNTFTYTKTYPAICACVWESSACERKIFAYNYSDDAKTMEFAGKVYEVAPKSFGCFDLPA